MPTTEQQQQTTEYFASLFKDSRYNIFADVGVNPDHVDIVAMHPKTNTVMHSVQQTRLGHQFTACGHQLNFIEILNGVRKEGIANEDLLLVLLYRMSYLDSRFPCIENKVAIDHMKAALECLLDRTSKRIEQNVEGKEIPHAS